LMRSELQGAEEARGVTRREQLSQVGPFAAGPTELLRRGQLQVELPVMVRVRPSRPPFAVAEVRYFTSTDMVQSLLE
jgi:hypothetical protein